jgi:DNA-binding protein Fis
MKEIPLMAGWPCATAVSLGSRGSRRSCGLRQVSGNAALTNLKSRNGVVIGGPRCLKDVEKEHILRVLDECGGNQTRAAEVLGIDRVTLHHKLKKYGSSRNQKELVTVESQ